MKQWLLLAVYASVFCLPARSFADSPEAVERILGEIPVQHSGRVKPYASFAREMVLYITGKSSFEGELPTITVWRWQASPNDWSARPLIKVTHPDLRAFFANDLERNRIAPALVVNHLEFSKEIRVIQAKDEKKETLNTLEKKKIELFSRARVFEQISHGHVPGFIPHPVDPIASWLPPSALTNEQGLQIASQLYPSKEIAELQGTHGHLLARLKSEEIAAVVTAAGYFRDTLMALLASRDVVLDRTRNDLELWYWKLKPFQLAWIFYLLSAVLLAVPKRNKRLLGVTLGFYLTGFLTHTLGFALRTLISGRAPVTNMYESVVWVTWAVVLFALVLWFFYRSTFLPVVAACVATFGLLLAASFPVLLDPAISPLVPVLRSNFWLTIHVLTITLGYGAFALNWGMAHALLYHHAFRSGRKKRIAELTEYLYRALQIGIILLGSGIVLGGVWASYSWGRFWGWDPKETWALIALMSYLGVFHGRIAGWLSPVGVALASGCCFLVVLMAWYGVNFVLGVGLHSYGFGGGGLPYVIAVALADVGLLAFLASRVKSKGA